MKGKTLIQKIRKQLVAGGVIGGVVDDFVPINRFSLLCGLKEIGFGEQVSADYMKSQPRMFSHQTIYGEPDPSFFQNTIFVLVMTDPETPGHEYLHWLNTSFFSTKPADFIGDNLHPYEPPGRPTSRSQMVFTLFKEPGHPIIQPNSRENFSTRAFANENRLGLPVAAGFFYIKIQNENKHRISWTAAKEKEKDIKIQNENKHRISLTTAKEEERDIKIQNENKHRISLTAAKAKAKEKEKEKQEKEKEKEDKEKEKHDHERRISWTECSTSYSKSKPQKSKKR